MKSWAWWIGFVIFVLPLQRAYADEQAAWQALADGGHVALMRHATAPGVGDPAEFTIGDCTTQRNLSGGGREEARAIGKAFREKAIRVAGVYSSQWCRCVDTAKLLELGRVETLQALNSFFRRSDRRDAQTSELRNWLHTHRFTETLILVTHQVNITGLTGVFPQSGEIVVVRSDDEGDVSVVGRISSP